MLRPLEFEENKARGQQFPQSNKSFYYKIDSRIGTKLIGLNNRKDNAGASYSPLDRYRKIKSLGFGVYGHVFLVVDTQSKLSSPEKKF